MKNTPNRPSASHKKLLFDIPIAGWVFSVVSFLCGTTIPALYDRLTYDGIAAGQVSSLQYSSSLTEGRGLFKVEWQIKLVNTTKNSLVVDAISSNLSSISTATPLALDYSAAWLLGKESDEEYGDLPLLVKPESVTIIEVSQLYSYPLHSPNDLEKITASIAKELNVRLSTSGLQQNISINGKLRQLSLTGVLSVIDSRILQPYPPPPPPPPPPYVAPQNAPASR